MSISSDEGRVSRRPDLVFKVLNKVTGDRGRISAVPDEAVDLRMRALEKALQKNKKRN